MATVSSNFPGLTGTPLALVDLWAVGAADATSVLTVDGANGVIDAGVGTPMQYYFNSPLDTVDHEASIVMADETVQGMGPMVRYNPATGECYFAETSGGTCFIYKRVLIDGVLTDVGLTSYSITGSTFSIRVIDDKISCNGGDEVTDGDLVAGLYAGIARSVGNATGTSGNNTFIAQDASPPNNLTGDGVGSDAVGGGEFSTQSIQGDGVGSAAVSAGVIAVDVWMAGVSVGSPAVGGGRISAGANKGFIGGGVGKFIGD